jgi:CheY-like chemotaxis protein
MDPGQLDQVVVNLVVNARDAMPRGGRIRIATGKVARDADYAARHADAPAGDYVWLSVADTGEGMDRATRDRIFEPFFTTKKGGTGLGLASCYGIVTQARGHLRVESEVGRGTTLTVFLPASRSAPSVTATPVASGRRARPGGTVLLVEDENLVRMTVGRGLETRGYKVRLAANGAEALEAVRRHHGAIDAAVLDVVMPGIDGRHLARKIGELQPSVPVLFVCGYSDEMLEAREVQPPEVDLLAKPFTLDALCERIEEIIARGAQRKLDPRGD